MYLKVNRGHRHTYCISELYLELHVWQASLEESIAQAFEIAVRVRLVAQRIEQHEAQSVVRAQGGVLDQRLDALYTSKRTNMQVLEMSILHAE